MDKLNFASKVPSVPKETDKSEFMELLPDGGKSEMLSFELISGSMVAFPYHLMSKLTMDEPTTIRIHFSENVMVIKGICLRDLYNRVFIHQVSIIREKVSRGFDINGKLSIESITVEKPEN